jgi:hypothetical protein
VIVRRTGLEDLAMRCLVPEEGELREDYAERAGQQQLQPRVVEQDHSCRAARQRKQQNHEDHQIETSAATLQPPRTDGLGQRGEGLGERLVA